MFYVHPKERVFYKSRYFSTGFLQGLCVCARYIGCTETASRRRGAFRMYRVCS